MKVDYSGLYDLFQDWLTAIPETKVSLRRVKIYRIHDVRYSEDKALADVTITDAWTMTQRKCVASVPTAWAERLDDTGVFYKTGGMRYVPTDEVKGHILNDYFHVSSRRDEDMEEDEKDAEDLVLAEKFRRVDQIVFIARRPSKGYAELVGLKSARAGQNRVRAVDIAGCLKGDYSFFTSYPHQAQEQPGLDFVFECRHQNWKTADGTPFWLSFSDTANGRRSIRIDVVVGINGRQYIIDCLEISHRSAATAEKIANQVLRMAESHRGDILNLSVDANTVTRNCLKFVPKKTRGRAMDSIVMNACPIEAAYDAMETYLFNPRKKQHRTFGYDGGRRKYELALGYTLKCC